MARLHLHSPGAVYLNHQIKLFASPVSLATGSKDLPQITTRAEVGRCALRPRLGVFEKLVDSRSRHGVSLAQKGCNATNHQADPGAQSAKANNKSGQRS